MIGAHALGFNTGTVGVALIGNYSPRAADAARAGPRSCVCSHGGSTSRTSIRSRSVVDTSAGNAKFKAGKVVTLRAISGHRDTGPTECPGNRDLRAAARDRAARRRRPACRSSTRSTASGALGGADPLPGTAVVGASVDGHGHHREREGRRAWRAAARARSTGSGAPPGRARGRSGGGWMRGRASSRRRARSAATSRDQVPKPRRPTPPVTPSRRSRRRRPRRRPSAGEHVVSGLTVTPATITPASDGSGVATTVELHARRGGAGDRDRHRGTGGLPLLDSALGPAAGRAETTSGTSASSRTAGTSSWSRRQPVGGDAGRGLGRRHRRSHARRFLATPAAFSPNGDGLNDTIDAVVPAHPVGLRAGRDPARRRDPRHDLLGAGSRPGIQAIGWDGASDGARLPDGDYVAVVTATSSLGTVSLLQPVSIDTTAPVLTLSTARRCASTSARPRR